MGIRETINQYPAVAIAAVAVVVVGAGVYVYSFMRENASPRHGAIAYYSDDDGRSYFEESNKRIAPFDHDGKPAYRAHVYTCDGGKTTWVAYLEGYRPEARPQVEEITKYMDELVTNPNAKPPKPGMDPMFALPELNRTSLTYKRPDQPGKPPNKWVSQSDGGEYGKAQAVVCPHGDPNHHPDIVLP